jgi:hypothetical protein
MKKLIVSLLLISLVKVSLAQFTLNPKIAKVSGSCSKFLLEATSQFTKTTNDTPYKWEVLEINIPSGWEFGMCSPFECKSALSIGDFGKYYDEGEFKGDFSPNNISGSGSAKVLISSMSNPSIKDTLIFTANAWAVGMREIAKNNSEFTYYPNPAKDKLIIKFNVKEPITINLFNILGAKVKSFVHTGSESEINIADLQNGMYFLRFKEGNQTISKSFAKTE